MVESSQEVTEITYKISGDYRIDVLLEDETNRWNSPEPLQSTAKVTYSFMTAAPLYADASDAAGFSAFNSEQKAATRKIFSQISQNFNIDFTEVDDTYNIYGQIRLGNNNQGETSSGYAYMPFSSGDKAGDLYLNNQSADNLSNMTPGTYAYATLVHEIGHTLGLKHPGNYNAGESASTEKGNYLAKAEDTTINTIMSYIDPPQGQQRDFFTVYDYLALQYLYGSRSVNAGANTYKYTNDSGQMLQTINDSAGADTIDASACTVTVSIDLQEGRSSSIGSLSDGSTVASNNVSITYGTTIENIIGGTQADTLVGNASANKLAGGAGSDTLDGGGGIDTAVFTDTRKSNVITPTNAGYTVSGADGTDALTNIERLQFSDEKVAFDFGSDGNATKATKLLGAVFGKDSVNSKEYVGVVLGLLDAGNQYSDLMKAAVDFKLGNGETNASVVNLFYTNLVGTAPSASDQAALVNLLDSGMYSVASFGVAVADLGLNTSNINLVGLATTGVEYL